MKDNNEKQFSLLWQVISCIVLILVAFAVAFWGIKW